MSHSKLSTSRFECFKSFLPPQNIGAFKLAWLFQNFKSCDAWSQHLERNMRLFISYDGRLRKGFRAQRKERADEEVEQYNSFSSRSLSSWHWRLRLGRWWPQSVNYDQKKACQLMILMTNMMTKEMMITTMVMMTNRGNGRAWPTVGRHLCISSCQACTCTIIIIFMIIVIIMMIIIIINMTTMMIIIIMMTTMTIIILRSMRMMLVEQLTRIQSWHSGTTQLCWWCPAQGKPVQGFHVWCTNYIILYNYITYSRHSWNCQFTHMVHQNMFGCICNNK